MRENCFCFSFMINLEKVLWSCVQTQRPNADALHVLLYSLTFSSSLIHVSSVIFNNIQSLTNALGGETSDHCHYTAHHTNCPMGESWLQLESKWYICVWLYQGMDRSWWGTWSMCYWYHICLIMILMIIVDAPSVTWSPGLEFPSCCVTRAMGSDSWEERGKGSEINSSFSYSECLLNVSLKYTGDEESNKMLLLPWSAVWSMATR